MERLLWIIFPVGPGCICMPYMSPEPTPKRVAGLEKQVVQFVLPDEGSEITPLREAKIT